ncbi:MAG: hypothetical protein ABI629_07975 [bacterium]
MSRPPQFVEALLALPIPALALFVIAFWGLIALAVHRLLVPWITRHKAEAFGKFEAEVAAQLGIVLGLLLSFNAVTVWEQSTAARDATMAEASALRDIADLLPEIAPLQRDKVRTALQVYLAYVVHTEWPSLGNRPAGISRPAALRALAQLARASGEEELRDAVAAAIKARDDRIRIASARMLPARWTIVMVLGALTLLSVGLVHAEYRRARAVALAMLSFAIASCFVVLMAQARPFLGALAIQPTELVTLHDELDAPAVAH